MPQQIRVRFNKDRLESFPLPAVGKRITLHDTEVPGLQLRITSSGVKSFCVFRRSKRGEPERITIGRFPTLSVEHARNKAKRHLADLSDGISISARQRSEALETRTLDEVHREYLASRGVTLITIKRKDGKSVERPIRAANAKIKALTARDYAKAINLGVADWRDKPIAKITRDVRRRRRTGLSGMTACPSLSR